MKIVNRPFLEFSEEEQEQLTCLTYYWGSHMKNTIDDHPESIDAFVAYQNSKIVGWAMVVGWEKDWDLFMIFVDYDHRLKGIGTAIAREAKKKYESIGMVRDFESEDFVDKLCEEMKIHTVEEL